MEVQIAPDQHINVLLNEDAGFDEVVLDSGN
jgi:hypothetical protein